MAGLTLILDPDENPLPFVSEEDGSGFKLMAPLKVPRPQREHQMVSSIETEGELSAGGKDKNIELQPILRIVGSDEEDFRQRQIQLEQKLNRYSSGEGGILRLVYPDGKWIDYEIRAVNGGEGLITNSYLHSWRAEEEVTFTCGPFGRGEEELVGEFKGSDRVVEALVEDTRGTAPALARAEVVGASDTWELLWGLESRYLSEEDTAAPYYAAADLTPLAGAVAQTTTVDGKAGVSVVRQGTLSPNWTAQLSLQIPGVGHLTHQGIYEVYTWVHMPTSNTGEIGVGFEYGVGDMQIRTTLDPVYFEANHPREGKVVRITVGQAFLRAGARSPHQWEGRVLTRSTVVGDDFDILGVGFRPLAEGNSRVIAAPALRQPAALQTRDEFNQSAGNLHDKVLAAAGTFSGPKSVGTAANDSAVGTVSWSSPGNVTSENGSAAEAKFSPGNSQTRYLKATNPGFAIPSDATIEGFTVEVKRRALRNPAGEDLYDVSDASVRSVKAGSVSGASRADSTPWSYHGFAYKRYGGPSDLWGTTWTPAQINASTFGVAISAKVSSLGELSGEGVAVDHVRVTVYYALSGGEKWATTGDAQDITVDATTHLAQRIAVSDASLTQGRYAVAGATLASDIVVGLQVQRSSTGVGATERVRGGALARYVDENNWLFFGLDVNAAPSPAEESLRVFKRVGGGEPVELDRVSIPRQFDVTRSLWLHVDSRGRWFAWGALGPGGIPRLLMAGQDYALAEGEALDDGRTGFYDVKTGSNACTRVYDNFVAWVPPLQAIAYKDLPLELRHDGVSRQAPNGGWGDLVPENDYLTLPPAGMENRKARLVFIASPHDPDSMGVGFPEELTVKLWRTPRYRGVPDPA